MVDVLFLTDSQTWYNPDEYGYYFKDLIFHMIEEAGPGVFAALVVYKGETLTRALRRWGRGSIRILDVNFHGHTPSDLSVNGAVITHKEFCDALMASGMYRNIKAKVELRACNQKPADFEEYLRDTFREDLDFSGLPGSYYHGPMTWKKVLGYAGGMENHQGRVIFKAYARYYPNSPDLN